MNEEAKSFAKQQEELIRKQLGDMYSNLTSSKDASITEAELRKQNLLSKIEQSRQPIENQFQTDTRGAYANKMLSQQSVGDLLNRMNLSNSGFGMGQRIGVDTAYGKDVAGLMSSRADAIQGLENQKLNTLGEHNATLAGIDSTYAGAKLDMDKYIGERATQAYDKAYANYVNEQQIKWERDFQQKQANIANNQAWARINLERENSLAAQVKAQKDAEEADNAMMGKLITQKVPSPKLNGDDLWRLLKTMSGPHAIDFAVNDVVNTPTKNLWDLRQKLEAGLELKIIDKRDVQVVKSAFGITQKLGIE